jgi:hypothetical protein
MPYTFRGSMDGTANTDMVRFEGSLNHRILSLFVGGRMQHLSPSMGDSVHLFLDHERGSALAWSIGGHVESALGFGSPEELRREALEGLERTMQESLVPQGWFGLRPDR